MSGGDDSASKQAQKNEQQRQQAIASGTAQVNQIFDDPNRTSQYQKLAGDTTAYYTNDLNQQKALTDRNLKFAQARNGQIGGSVQADQATKSGEDYLKGILEANRRGQAAGASLQASDETSRANLIASVQGGLDATTAASNAASALRSNLASSQSTSTANQLGDTFGDFANIYQQSKDAAALRAGQKYAYNTLYTPSFGYGAPAT